MLSPFEVLFEAEGLPQYALPVDLKHVYGRLGFRKQVVYSNFVSSIDGVVALGSKPSAGSVISGKDQADRFLMGMLRACADVVRRADGQLNQGYQPPLCIAITVDIPLGGLNGLMSCQQLDVSQGSASLVH